jgi:hypothetical protein
VFDLLSFLGTTPTYRLPEITDQLIEQMVEAFDAGNGEELPKCSRSDLIDFLGGRRGKFVAPDDRLPS